MRLVVYGGVSSLLTTAVIAAAFSQRSHFYAACIQLSQSSAAMMVLLNMGIFLTILFGKFLQYVFFGGLRAVEVEHLYERAWFAVTETCLAMTIFREEFDTHFVVVFTSLLFIKIFHWLCQDRVDFMEQSPTISVLFHVRMSILMSILCIIDCFLVHYSISVTMQHGPNMMIMFGFEYAILASMIISTLCKYILHTIDLRSEEPWENKSIYVFYLELVTDFVKLATYLVFFAIIMVYYGLPLHIIRDVYVTFRSFVQKCRDLIRYRQATRNMNERYPDATGEELERMSDRTCIICREEMEAPRLANADQQENVANGEAAAGRPVRNRTAQSLGETPKKLPCGHIFHFRCLRSWLERQQSCPTCRRTVLPEPPAANPIPQNQPLAPQQRVPPAGLFGNQGPVFAPHMLIPNQQPLPNQRMNPTNNDQAGNETPRTDQNETGQTSNGTATETSPPTYNSITSEHMRETLRQGQYPLNGVPHLQSYQAPNGPQMLPGLIPLGQLSNLIPLFPQQPLSYDLESFALSDEQLSVLETETRQALQERLRICEEAQRRLFDVATTLTQALSILPTPLSATPTFVPNPRERPESSLNLGHVQSSSVNEPNPNPTPAIIPSDDVSRRTMEEANPPNSLDQPIESPILEEVENEIGNQESKEDTTSSISPNSTSENDKGKSPEKVVLRTEDEEQEIEKSWTRFEDN